MTFFVKWSLSNHIIINNNLRRESVHSTYFVRYRKSFHTAQNAKEERE